jgi:hypothetical protein
MCCVQLASIIAKKWQYSKLPHQAEVKHNLLNHLPFILRSFKDTALGATPYSIRLRVVHIAICVLLGGTHLKI